MAGVCGKCSSACVFKEPPKGSEELFGGLCDRCKNVLCRNCEKWSATEVRFIALITRKVPFLCRSCADDKDLDDGHVERIFQENKRLSEFINELEEKNGKITDQFQIQINKLNDSLKDKELEIQRLRKRTVDFHDDASIIENNLESEIGKLKNSVRLLNKKNMDLNDENIRFKKIVHESELKLEHLTVANETKISKLEQSLLSSEKKHLEELGKLNLCRAKLEEEIEMLKTKLSELINNIGNLELELSTSALTNRTLDQKIQDLERNQRNSIDEQISQNDMIKKLKDQANLFKNVRRELHKKFKQQEQVLLDKISRLEVLNSEHMKMIKDLEIENIDLLDELVLDVPTSKISECRCYGIETSLRALAKKAREVKVINTNLLYEINDGLRRVSRMENTTIDNTTLMASRESTTANKILLLTDSYDYRLSDNLLNILGGTDASLQIISKRHANFSQVTEDAKELTRGFGMYDFLVVLAGINGVVYLKDVQRLVGSIAHTNVIVCTVPVRPYHFQTDRIYSNNETIRSIKNDVNYHKSNTRVLDISSCLMNTSYFTKFLPNREGRILMSTLIGQLLVRAFPLVNSTSLDKDVDSDKDVDDEDETTKELWARLNTLAAGHSLDGLLEDSVSSPNSALSEDINRDDANGNVQSQVDMEQSSHVNDSFLDAVRPAPSTNQHL